MNSDEIKNILPKSKIIFGNDNKISINTGKCIIYTFFDKQNFYGYTQINYLNGNIICYTINNGLIDGYSIQKRGDYFYEIIYKNDTFTSARICRDNLQFDGEIDSFFKPTKGTIKSPRWIFSGFVHHSLLRPYKGSFYYERMYIMGRLKCKKIIGTKYDSYGSTIGTFNLHDGSERYIRERRINNAKITMHMFHQNAYISNLHIQSYVRCILGGNNQDVIFINGMCYHGKFVTKKIFANEQYYIVLSK